MPSGNGSAVTNDGQWLDENFPLHHAVFHNDVKKLEQLLEQGPAVRDTIDRVDTHGNSALHIACMLGRRECIELLLSHGASIGAKNNLEWNCLHEAVSYGDRNILEMMLTALKKQSHETLTGRLPLLAEHFSKLGDFYMETKWEVFSWIPLVSRLLPFDTFKIYKKGSRLRVDLTLIGFNDRGAVPKWERGDVSLLLDMTATDGRKAVLMDHQKKVYQVLHAKNRNLREELECLMSTDISSIHISTRPIHFVQAKSLLLFPKSEYVGKYKAHIYNIKGMQLVTQKRREHLSEEDLKLNKEMQSFFTDGNLPARDVNTEGPDPQHQRPSLSPPPQPSLNWSQYLRAADKNSHLGRQMHEKVSTKECNGTVAMSSDFPLSLDVVLDILSVLEPLNPTMAKLRNLCTARLPPGFPVRVEMPIYATIQARISFEHFNWCGSGEGAAPPLSAALFKIPDNYHEDPKRFKRV